MTKSLLAVFAMLIAVTVGGAFAAGNTTTDGYQPTMMSGGHPVFYIVLEDDGGIHPASASERIAIDRAIADGTVRQVGLDQFRARDLY